MPAISKRAPVTQIDKPLSSSAKEENQFIAEKLAEVADLLAGQGADAFRIRAYREAAEFVDQMHQALRAVYDAEGTPGLVALPTIGTSIAGAIAAMLNYGDLGMLRRLRDELDPEMVFQTVPTIGPAMARKIHAELGIETLEGLEMW